MSQPQNCHDGGCSLQTAPPISIRSLTSFVFGCAEIISPWKQTSCGHLKNCSFSGFFNLHNKMINTWNLITLNQWTNILPTWLHCCPIIFHLACVVRFFEIQIRIDIAGRFKWTQHNQLRRPIGFWGCSANAALWLDKLSWEPERLKWTWCDDWGSSRYLSDLPDSVSLQWKVCSVTVLPVSFTVCITYITWCVQFCRTELNCPWRPRSEMQSLQLTSRQEVSWLTIVAESHVFFTLQRLECKPSWSLVKSVGTWRNLLVVVAWHHAHRKGAARSVTLTFFLIGPHFLETGLQVRSRRRSRW